MCFLLKAKAPNKYAFCRAPTVADWRVLSLRSYPFWELLNSGAASVRLPNQGGLGKVAGRPKNMEAA